jgi:hypothetical protein
VRRRNKALVVAGVVVGVALVALNLPIFVDTAARRAAVHNLGKIDKPKEKRVLEGELIAHYRFDTNGNDSLGRSPTFVVTNGDQVSRGLTAFVVVTNAPFTNGVLYVNGQYDPNGHFVNYLGTAPMGELRYESFTVALDFYPLPRKRGRANFKPIETKLDTWTGGRYARWLGFDGNRDNTENILTGGYGYRWIGFNRRHGVLNLTLNNQRFVRQFAAAPVKPSRWHNLICSVDLQRKKILTFFDGQPLDAITLPADFKLEVIGSPAEAEDREFTFSNLSNGSVFFGYAAHLKILGRALTEAELASLYNESVRERPKFPQAVFDWWPVVVIVAVAGVAVLLIVWLRRGSGAGPTGLSRSTGQTDHASSAGRPI